MAASPPRRYRTRMWRPPPGRLSLLKHDLTFSRRAMTARFPAPLRRVRLCSLQHSKGRAPRPLRTLPSLPPSVATPVSRYVPERAVDQSGPRPQTIRYLISMPDARERSIPSQTLCRQTHASTSTPAEIVPPLPQVEPEKSARRQCFRLSFKVGDGPLFQVKLLMLCLNPRTGPSPSLTLAPEI